MIELLFTVCLIAEPDKCDDRHLTYAEAIMPMACLMGAQGELARWSEKNPKWQIERWRCRHVRSAARDA